MNKSRKIFKNKMFSINIDNAIQKMTDYYETVDYGKVDIPPFMKAKVDVFRKLQKGQFDELGRLI